MIAIASERSSSWQVTARPVAARPCGSTRFAATSGDKAAAANRAGSLRSIGDIVGELLAGYDLTEATLLQTAAAPEAELALAD
jgi:hypothetical protein